MVFFDIVKCLLWLGCDFVSLCENFEDELVWESVGDIVFFLEEWMLFGNIFCLWELCVDDVMILCVDIDVVDFDISFSWFMELF